MTNMHDPAKILVLGAAGMLGSTVFRYFCDAGPYNVTGTLRSDSKRAYFTGTQQDNLVSGLDVTSDYSVRELFAQTTPDVVINCIGIIKQLHAAKNHLMSLEINSMLPHKLAQLCEKHGARLVHLSTDCVFSGEKGLYTESDFPDANDLYGRTKYLGEVDYPHAITLRTSIVGHELSSTNSLVDWFLSQKETVHGFGKAVFSGLPTTEIARIIDNHVIPNPELHGLYHVSADPIDKLTLLRLIADVYKKDIQIIRDDKLVIDRSLNSGRFRTATGFVPDAWPILVQKMHDTAQLIGSKNV
ncbi:dTDP-4-dehydrorhamnose reductase family protein [Sulfitobacter pontiacus]|uniref:dTDP-4-dehydrorhamnose reductase family protein n=1 Tax=Sulfitobacter pontiacus TaxID=60137 RepID=UPI0030EC8CDB